MKIGENPTGPSVDSANRAGARIEAKTPQAMTSARSPAAKVELSDEGRERAQAMGKEKTGEATEGEAPAGRAKSSKGKGSVQDKKDVLTQFYAKKLAKAINDLEQTDALPAGIPGAEA